MEAKEFILGTVGELDSPVFEKMKETLVGQYLFFPFLEVETITPEIFSEKLWDYFKTVEINTDCSFEKILRRYARCWESIVQGRVPKRPPVKKGVPASPPSRVLKYYDHACGRAKEQSLDLDAVIDVSRIMLCIYMSGLRLNGQVTQDFDFAAKDLEIDRIFAALTEETTAGQPTLTKKGKRFDLSDPYGIDTCIFVLTGVLYYLIINTEEAEE